MIIRGFLAQRLPGVLVLPVLLFIKTLLKLEERDLVIKEQDEENRKRHNLFLTEKGQLAYQYHEEYHNQHDKSLFDYVDGLPSDQLEAIKDFFH